MKEGMAKMEGEKRKKREVERVEGEKQTFWREGGPSLGAWEREAALRLCHPSPSSCTPSCYPPHLPTPVPLTELLPESHTGLLRRWRVEARKWWLP